MKKVPTAKNNSSGAQDSQFDEWALLELFGHQRMAGRVREFPSLPRPSQKESVPA